MHNNMSVTGVESKSKKRGLKKCSTAACHRQLWPQLIQNDFSSKVSRQNRKKGLISLGIAQWV